MAKELAEGDPAPDFELPTDGGRSARLSDHKGKPAVIYFYPKDDTGLHRRGHRLQSLAGQLRRRRDRNHRRLAGQRREPRQFKRKHELKIALAADLSGRWSRLTACGRKRACTAASISGVERSTFLIDRNGRIARVWRR